MFTSRAEFRLSLREDNADMRLTELGWKLGVVSAERWSAFNRKRDVVEAEKQRLKSTWVNPNLVGSEEAIRVLGKRLEREYTLADLLKRPQVSYEQLATLRAHTGELISNSSLVGAESEQVEIQIKYEGYINRQQEEVERQKLQDELLIPDALDYDELTSLSFEVRQKLKTHRPATLGAAARISGITPAAISTLLVHLKKRSYQSNSREAA